ncbi:MAG: tyrosine-type recombinase/integrase [Oscillospiraceae bacterium]|nr:tyrosine-type recombinase/integrase [Oscillospiraceae bacterium]
MPQYKYKTAKGLKWMAKFNYEDPKTGETNTEYKRGFTSKREAKEYEEAFLEKLTETEEEEESFYEPTFGDVFHEYLASHKHEDIKASSLGTKYNIFEHHIFPTFHDKPVDEITDDDIANWQNEIKALRKPNGKPFSDSYLRTIQSQFNSIINYAFSKGYLHHNPLADIKNMGVKDKRVEFWTAEEYERFAYCAMNAPEYYYAYEVLYWCGLREGEMLALTLGDIDLKGATISITKTYQRVKKQDVVTTPKTPSSVRTVSMPAFLCDELQEYIDMLYEPKTDDRIFMVSKSKLAQKFHKFAEEAGLKRITVHGLRHSHVSLLISKKYDIFEISKRIGHKSIKTTQDIYGHLFDDVQKTIANDLDNIRRG